jgi:hypothetical protein
MKLHHLFIIFFNLCLLKLVTFLSHSGLFYYNCFLILIKFIDQHQLLQEASCLINSDFDVWLEVLEEVLDFLMEIVHNDLLFFF